MGGGRERIATKAVKNSILVGTVLAGAKLAAGLLANSSAMIADAVHSISDIATSFVVMLGIRHSSKEADSEHQYGHERMESVASMIVGVVLLITGLWMGFEGVISVAFFEPTGYPGVLALYAAVASIIVKELMYWYTTAVARRVDSEALRADAWHHRSDAMSSVGSLAGILGARAGMPILDELASVVICVFIIKAGWNIAKEALDKLTDHSCDAETLERIRTIMLQGEGVMGIEELRTRMFGNRIYVDADIYFNGELSLREAHARAKAIHDRVEEQVPSVKHCMIHVSPYV